MEVKIFRQDVPNNGNVVVLQFDTGTNEDVMERVVSEIAGYRAHIVFKEKDNPCLRVIVFDINELAFETRECVVDEMTGDITLR